MSKKGPAGAGKASSTTVTPPRAGKSSSLLDKVMLDVILGENNFQSEIIWRRNLAKGLAFTGFPNNHDTILYYGGSDTLSFNRPYIAYDPDNLDEKTASKYSHRDPMAAFIDSTT